MSKKELLNETQIRRFMKLANLEPLAKNVLSEMQAQEEMKEAPAPAMQEEMGMEEEGEGMEVELDDAEGSAGGGDVDSKAIVQATVSALVAGLKKAGLDVGDISVEDEEEGGEDEEGAAGMEDEMPMDVKAGAEDAEDEEQEEDEGEMKETASLSEDALVEAVLTRVTARLMEEAKKARAKKVKKGVADKMAKKKAEKPAEPATLEEATSAEGGGPLLKQGKNKHDVYKGHADMAYAKGKEGKGGHQMETVTAKAEHTVTHSGKNLATLGGNKKKV